MNSNEKKYENRKRCLTCQNYKSNVCTIMSNADVFHIDKCILEDARIAQIKKDTPEWFMFTHNPKLFLQYLNYQRKEKLPKIGSKVVTLREGFCGSAGATRQIKTIDERYITLINENGQESISSIKSWYKDFFEI